MSEEIIAPTDIPQMSKDGVTLVGISVPETPREEAERKQKEVEPSSQGGVEKPTISPKEDFQYEVKMWLVWSKENGKLRQVWVTEPPAYIIRPGFGVWPVTTKWTKPNWSKMTEYRQEAAKWSDQAQSTLVDRRSLHKIYIDNHLRDASGLLDRNGEEIRIKFDGNGALLPEVYKSILGMDLAVVDMMLHLYESNVLMSQS